MEAKVEQFHTKAPMLHFLRMLFFNACLLMFPSAFSRCRYPAKRYLNPNKDRRLFLFEFLNTVLPTCNEHGQMLQGTFDCSLIAHGVTTADGATYLIWNR